MEVALLCSASGGVRVQVRMQEIELDIAFDVMETAMQEEECKNKHVRTLLPNPYICSAGPNSPIHVKNCAHDVLMNSGFARSPKHWTLT